MKLVEAYQAQYAIDKDYKGLAERLIYMVCPSLKTSMPKVRPGNFN
jgi:hypothetical protein